MFEKALDILRTKLPPDWSAHLGSKGKSAYLTLKTKDGQKVRLKVFQKKTAMPKDIVEILPPFLEGDEVFVTSFLSPRACEILENLGVSYIDTTGNLRIVTSRPAIFIESRGEKQNPYREHRDLQSLRGATASRVIRALCEFLPPYGVRELSEMSSTPLGSTSRVVNFLEKEALIQRNERKKIIKIFLKELLHRWAQDYKISKSNTLSTYIEPRGLQVLLSKLNRLKRYAVTGSLASSSILPARLAMIYVEDAAKAAETLDLTPTETGVNVWLLEPYDNVVFERTESVQFGSHKLEAVSKNQVVVDLLTSPGRAPQEAEELLKKMKDSKDG